MSSENGWSDWGNAWRSDSETPGDVEAIERRVRRRQSGQALRQGLDIAVSVLALPICVWAILDGRPGSVITGLAGIAFVLFALAVTLGRRRTPGEMAARTVAGALEWEIATAKSAVRVSIGSLITGVAASAFLAVCAVVFGSDGVFERAPHTVWILVGGAAYIIAFGGACLWLLRRRQATVARLEQMLAELKAET